jgi:hypothetical protein
MSLKYLCVPKNMILFCFSGGSFQQFLSHQLDILHNQILILLNIYMYNRYHLLLGRCRGGSSGRNSTLKVVQFLIVHSNSFIHTSVGLGEAVASDFCGSPSDISIFF